MSGVLPRSEDEIRWTFMPTYDFSSFLSSELDEIRKHGSLEQYAMEQLIEEREYIFQKARKYDLIRNRAILLISLSDNEYRRFVCLEDALRQMMHGDCRIGFRRRNTYLFSENKVWLINYIPNSERVHIKEEELKYDKRYLEYIYKNKISRPLRFGWYGENKDNNIKTRIFFEDSEEGRSFPKNWGKKAQRKEDRSSQEDSEEDDSQDKA